MGRLRERLQTFLILIAGACALNAPSSHALPRFLEPPVWNGPVKYHHHYWPNEKYPIEARLLLQLLDEGIILTMGTERGLMAAALAPRITHLLLVDHDPTVVLFNTYNLLLIASARDRAEYLELRLHPDLAKYDAVARGYGLSEEDRKYLSDHFREWKECVSNPDFAEFHFPQDIKFQGANYLHLDALFDKLQGMARTGRAISFLGDFGDPAFARALGAGITAAHVPLGLIDVSNSLFGYLPYADFIRFLEGLGSAVRPETYVMTTLMADKPLVRERVIDGRTVSERSRSWLYTAYRRSYLLSRSEASGIPMSRLLEELENAQKNRTVPEIGIYGLECGEAAQ